MITELKPIHDSRKSFYGKAKVENDENGLSLISYTTRVVRIKDGKPIVYGLHSTTTTRHIKEFLKQNGFNDWKNSKDILAKYGVTQ